PRGGRGIALDANITIHFSEDVVVAGTWFEINCTTSGAHSATVTGGPQSYMLDPSSDFVMSETCTVDVFAAQVTDSDAVDPPDNMVSNFQFSFTTATPPVTSPILINEMDADQAGSDAAEFVELFDGGVGNTALDGLVIVLFNGSGDTSYQAFDLDGLSTNASGYFVLCGDAANTANCDLDVSPNTNLIQNGADAVALYLADATDFPGGSAVTTNGLIDAIVYDTDDADDATLLTLLNGGQPQVNERDGGDGSAHSNQRCPSGAGGARNTDTYIQALPTPGVLNDCPSPIINEVDADQTGTDAAEFIELFDGGVGNLALDGFVLVFFNGSSDTSYQAFDLDGQSTNANGYFVLCGDAANTANCDLDVTPNTNLIQNGADAVALYVGNASNFPNSTAATTNNLVDAIVYDTNDGDDVGLLALLNPGQPQINEGGGTDSGVDSNQRCTNGSGGERNTDTYTQATPTPGAVNECPPLEIWDIQGAGEFSMFADTTVSTVDNIVTAVGPEGFTMQTPDARADASIDTSNGIYVFTAAAPTVAVGDSVNVTGDVIEFFDFTEFANSPTVTINSSGNALPAVVIFDATVPSPNPATPSCAIEYECYESMLVQITGGSVTNGNQSFGSDPIAEVHIRAVATRSFREPGTQYPLDLGGSIPVWDGNPEVFELDPDRMGLPNIIIPGGSSFDAVGVIGFDFGGYELWPTSLTVTEAVIPGPVRGRLAGETTVGSLNLFRFATDGDYATRLSKLSQHIREVLNSPDILGVQEAADITALQDLATEIAQDDNSVNYTAHLVEGNDIGGIDVGFLLRADIAVDAITQLGAAEIFSFDSSILHDRPPLLLEGRYTGNGMDFSLAVMVVHNRSLNGIDTTRVQLKRLAQAESVATMVQTYQTSNPAIPLIVLGDFNAFEFTDGYVDVLGHIKGDFDPAESLQSGADLVNPNLVNQVELLPATERYSFNFRGHVQTLDHALTSAATDPWIRGFEFGRGNVDAAANLIGDPSTPLRAADHDGFVLYLMTDFDGDGVADDVDGCSFNANLANPISGGGCAIPIPTLDRWALLLMLLLMAGIGMLGLRRSLGVNS
ncbi:MAG: Ig-like domain-containing protein, partial [Xanthomonadales bacterium]|nr:Ig-like domain-containing protein [Xanthomonadales bacterium]